MTRLGRRGCAGVSADGRWWRVARAAVAAVAAEAEVLAGTVVTRAYYSSKHWTRPCCPHARCTQRKDCRKRGPRRAVRLRGRVVVVVRSRSRPTPSPFFGIAVVYAYADL